MKLPAGYVAVEAAGAQGFAIEAAADWLTATLGSHGSVHRWAEVHPDTWELQGRGRVFVVPAAADGPDGQAAWAVRHYRRGGAVAALLDDQYFAVGRTRPGRELDASVAVRARGVPAPAVVAGVVYPDGVLYRADLVTELVPDASDLADRLFGEDPDPAPERTLEAVGRFIRRLEVEGVFHPDLNAKNLLLQGHGAEPLVHVLDLDRCQVRPEGVAAPHGPMGERLRRSLRKFEASTQRRLPDEAWQALARGLEELL